LHGGEFGELTHPIGVETEGFEIAVLIEIGSFASIRGDGGLGIRDDGAILGIKRGEYARCVPGIVNLNRFGRQ
jgi:hypothetical protein